MKCPSSSLNSSARLSRDKKNSAAMSCSACQLPSRRTFFLSGLLLIVFLGTLYTYLSDFKYPDFAVYIDRGRQFCPNFLCAQRGQTVNSSSNSSTELQVTPQPNATQEIQRTAVVDAEPDTVVLIWMWPFGFVFSLNCDIFNVKKCHLTNDKTLYPKAHGVIFHHRDIGKMPKESRPDFQKWVWFNMESPANTVPIARLNNAFNLTCSYRLDSHIPVPYGHLEPLTSEDKKFKLPAKDKLVCWIVSNWSNNLKRVRYYNELKKHIEIHAYGGAFGKRPSREGYVEIVSSCKFYLAFENSIFRDYITEKTFRPMIYGTVPVALGPPRKNYEALIPHDSFIHVDDFSSPKELAERLHYLDQNHTEYMKYFSWRKQYKSMLGMFGRENACKTCKYLQSHKEHQEFPNLNKWFWG